MSGYARQYRIRNKIIRKKRKGIVPIVEKNVEPRLRWVR